MQREFTLTIHMASSLDGFIARSDGTVDWMETKDHYEAGDAITPEYVEQVLAGIDAYVMGSHTYETALAFEEGGAGWAYGDTPVFVLTTRELPRNRDTVQFHQGDLKEFVEQNLRPRFSSVWVVGGGTVCGAFARLGLADELRASILPVLIGDGVPFFDALGRDVPLHLLDVQAFDSGMVELHYSLHPGSPDPVESPPNPNQETTP